MFESWLCHFIEHSQYARAGKFASYLGRNNHKEDFFLADTYVYMYTLVSGSLR